MSDNGVLLIHTDGAARGNPGPAAFAYTIEAEGADRVEEAGCLGAMTNNQAEYIALVRALEHAARLGTGHALRVHSDSELLVKQMNGEYRVKDDTLRGYYEQAQKLRRLFSSVQIRHVRRAQNADADRLCNEVLDGVRLSSVLPPGPVASGPAQIAPARPAPAQAVAPDPRLGRRDRARARTLDLLRSAAATWTRDGAAGPTPEAVCDQLWAILEETKVLRQPRKS